MSKGGYRNESPTRDRKPDNGYRRRDSSSPRKTSWSDSLASGSGWGDSSSAPSWVDPSSIKGESTSTWGNPPPSKTRGGTPLSTWGQDLKATPLSHHPPAPLSSLPPPPPSLPPPPPPPPPEPMPSHRPFESGPSSRPNTRVSSTKFGDMRKLYMTRVRQLSEAVLLRNEYTQVIRILESRRKMLSSQRYSHVSETSQSRLDGYAQEYEDKARDLKSRLDDTISKLVESEPWPEGSPAVEPNPTYEAALQQLQDVQTRLQSLENAIKTDVGQRPPLLPDSLEGKKRRRHSVSEERIDTGTLGRLEALETRFDDVTNEATQQVENLFQKIEARIEEKLETLPISAIVEEVRNDDSSADVRKQVASLTKDYEGFADEMVDLVQKNKDLALGLKKLSEDNEALKMRNNELESSQNILKSDMERLNDEVQAVLSAMRIQKPTTPPGAALSAADLEQMREQMREQICTDIMAELTPVLSELRDHCELVVDSGREEILKHIGAKLGRTTEMVDVIYSFVQTQREL